MRNSWKLIVLLLVYYFPLTLNYDGDLPVSLASMCPLNRVTIGHHDAERL